MLETLIEATRKACPGWDVAAQFMPGEKVLVMAERLNPNGSGPQRNGVLVPLSQADASTVATMIRFWVEEKEAQD